MQSGLKYAYAYKLPLDHENVRQSGRAHLNIYITPIKTYLGGEAFMILFRYLRLLWVPPVEESGEVVGVVGLRQYC